MADEVSTPVRTVVERLLEADLADEIARRGRELSAAVADATETASARANKAWRESKPQRREAEKAARRASRDAVKWSRRAWRKEIRPMLRDLWNRRGAAIGATAAAVPASRELVEDAAVRLGIRQRESRHWLAFFLGILIGAAVGAIVAVLTAPKPGREMRDELTLKARDAAERAREEAGDWVPLFQRPATNGGAEAVIGEDALAQPADPAEPATQPLTEAVDVEATPEGEEKP